MNGWLPVIGIIAWFVTIGVAYLRFRRRDTTVALTEDASSALGQLYWAIIGGFVVCMGLVYVGERLL